MTRGPEVFVVSRVEVGEGGMVLGVFSSRDAARTFALADAAAAGVTGPSWRGMNDGSEATWNEGAAYWEIEPFVLDEVKP